MAGIKALISLSFGGAIGLMFLMLGCALPVYDMRVLIPYICLSLSFSLRSKYWPLFLLFFYILSPIPYCISRRVVDDTDSASNACKELAIFLTTGIVISAFGLPIVFARAEVVSHAMLERDFLVSREKERKLQNDLEAVTAQLFHQEQANMELRMKQDELISTIHQKQIEEKHSLDLQFKTVEVERLQDTNTTLAEELEELHNAHQKEVRELQQEKEVSLRKLQETVEQFEWLFQQQCYWICCVKRFKDSLMKEREALLRQVRKLKKKAEKLKKILYDSPTHSVLCPLQDTKCCDSSITSWNPDAVADLESRVEESNTLYEELYDQTYQAAGPGVTSSRKGAAPGFATAPLTMRDIGGSPVYAKRLKSLT
eukprot:superscaffoldBa00000549_g5568